jgi:DNA polymerase-4
LPSWTADKIAQPRAILLDFHTLTRARTLACPTNVTQELRQAATELFSERVLAECRPVRLLGMGVSGLQPSNASQQQLFDEEEHRKHGQLDAVADAVQDRVGGDAIRRGTRLRPPDH